MTTKLIRDRIPEIAAAHGRQLQIHVAGTAEAAELLVAKLEEEALEVAEAEERDDLLEELADVLEALHALTRICGWTLDDLEAARLRKHAERGGFDRRIVLTTPESCQHCRAQIQWIDCPTGGWWAHDVHPADDHDAEPAA